MIYYMFGMLFYHSKIRLHAVDRNTHNLMSMHVCLHFLFVDVYIMIPSVVVLCVFLWYVFFGRQSERAALPDKLVPSLGAALGTAPAHGHSLKSDEDLLLQLRAAKAKATMV
jgi:hypothetical protein